MLSSGFEGMQSISYIKIFIVIVPEGEMTANFIIKKKIDEGYGYSSDKYCSF
jgi:hypothetical protein